MLLHNWGTGHEKRDFARDTIFVPKNLWGSRKSRKHTRARKAIAKSRVIRLFLGGIPASTDFSAGFLPRYAAEIFPGKDDFSGKTGHLGGIDPGECRESWRYPRGVPLPTVE